MVSASMPQSKRPNSRRVLFLFLIGLTDCILVLAYWPSLADSLESRLFIQPSSTPIPPPKSVSPHSSVQDIPGIRQPATLPADKVALDDDTPVIGIFAGGRARAYLLEAFERGPASHLVNDVVGGVPISVSHCDISGATRVFTGARSGQPLELNMGGLKDSRMLLKCGGRLYRQETSQPLDEGDPAFPFHVYQANLTEWGEWRHAHPETDVYMGAIEEATPPEAGGPRTFSHHKSSTPPPHHKS